MRFGILGCCALLVVSEGCYSTSIHEMLRRPEPPALSVSAQHPRGGEGVSRDRVRVELAALEEACAARFDEEIEALRLEHRKFVIVTVVATTVALMMMGQAAITGQNPRAPDITSTDCLPGGRGVGTSQCRFQETVAGADPDAYDPATQDMLVARLSVEAWNEVIERTMTSIDELLIASPDPDAWGNEEWSRWETLRGFLRDACVPRDAEF